MNKKELNNKENKKENPVFLEQWKQQFEVVSIEVEVNDAEKIAAYFKKPDFILLSAAQMTCGNDYAKMSQFLLNSCYLGGFDVPNCKDLQILLAFSSVFNELLQPKKASLKNV